jgi:hypothetical protein
MRSPSPGYGTITIGARQNDALPLPGLSTVTWQS